MPTKLTESIKSHPLVWLIGFIAVAVIPIISFFNVPIPKPAWSIDIKRLELQQLDTHIELLEDQKERAKSSRFKNLREQDQIERKNEPVPDFYLEEQSFIENKINRLETDIDAARERKIEEFWGQIFA